MRLALLAALNAERRARRACVVVGDLATGEQRLVRARDLTAEGAWTEGAGEAGAEGVGAPGPALAEALRAGRSRALEHGGRSLFLAVHAPPPRLVAVGAVHIAQGLAPMAAALGLDLTVLDPRAAFADPARFPGARVVNAWPQDWLPGHGIDRFTGVLALSHDPKIDDPALALALRADGFYVGALGSRRTHARRAERLAALGFDEGAIARVRAPIGLPIGAASPAEIALSVLAEVVAALRLPPPSLPVPTPPPAPA